MRKLAVALFIVILSAPCLVKSSIVAYFLVNREYISRTLCINRDNTVTICRGICFLDRNLNDVTNADHHERTLLERIDSDAHFIIPSAVILHLATPQLLTKHTLPKMKAYYIKFLSEIFQPPEQ